MEAFHYIKKIPCIRCDGTGKPNALTYPNQAGCCGLCNGTGKIKVKVYPSGKISAPKKPQ